MTNQVQSAIEKAREAAKNQAATNTNAVAEYTQPAGGAVQTYVAPKMKTLDDLNSAGLNVDAFLKVTEHGLEIKGLEGLIESITVQIDLGKNHIQVFDAVKYGNPAQYYKTYDGATCTTGGLWQDAVAKAQRVDDKVRPYSGADITMTLVEDALNVKGKVVAEKGLLLGHSTSTTNRANLASLIDAIKAQGLTQSVVEVKITSERKTNKNNNVWGVLNFELLGEAAPDAE